MHSGHTVNATAANQVYKATCPLSPAGPSAPPGNGPGSPGLPGGSWKMPWQMLGGKPSRTSRPCSPPHSASALLGLVLLQACVSTFSSYAFISMLLSFWELSFENTHFSRTAS